MVLSCNLAIAMADLTLAFVSAAQECYIFTTADKVKTLAAANGFEYTAKNDNVCVLSTVLPYISESRLVFTVAQ